eukprot:Pompholyxophrys_punicea_v1_NODE_21_length_5692_cov_19.735675.p1 type:complete len:878 gc:universal NODE_21_length_5692_cov_19.735675:4698-2065(-)
MPYLPPRDDDDETGNLFHRRLEAAVVPLEGGGGVGVGVVRHYVPLDDDDVEMPRQSKLTVHEGADQGDEYETGVSGKKKSKRWDTRTQGDVGDASEVSNPSCEESHDAMDIYAGLQEEEEYVAAILRRFRESCVDTDDVDINEIARLLDVERRKHGQHRDKRPAACGTALHAVVRTKVTRRSAKMEMIEYLIKRHPWMLMANEGDSGESVLHAACSGGIDDSTPDVIECILDHCSSPNMLAFRKDECGRTALHVAILQSNNTAEDQRSARLSVIRLLVERHPGLLDVEYPDSHDIACVAASASGLYGQLTTNSSIDINKATKVNKDNILHTACKAHKLSAEVINYLLECRPSMMGQCNTWGRTLLHIIVAAIVDGNDAASATVGWSVLDSMACWIKSDPDLLSADTKDFFGDTVLHVACKGRSPSAKLIGYLLDLSPGLEMMENGCGLTALHLAIQSAAAGSAKMEVITYIVDRNPEILSCKTPNGANFLHFALQKGYDHKEVIYYFSERCSGFAQEKDSVGQTPLHTAVQLHEYGISVRRLVALVQYVVQLWPDARLCRDMHDIVPLGRTRTSKWTYHNDVFLPSYECLLEPVAPLHFFCLHSNCNYYGNDYDDRNQDDDDSSQDPDDDNNYNGPQDKRAADMRYIQHLATRYPDTLAQHDAAGNYPIHCAVANKTVGLHVLVEILQLSPGYIQIRNALGSLPLHWAICHNGGRPDVIGWVFQQWPDAIREADGDRSYPLHLFICHNGGLPDAVRWVLEQWPDAIREANGDGNYPLHLAICNKVVCSETIHKLYNAWPNAASIRDSRGNWPLHMAIVARPLDSQLIQLMSLWSLDALHQVDSQGYLPWQLASIHVVDLETIFFLVKLCVEDIRKTP